MNVKRSLWSRFSFFQLDWLNLLGPRTELISNFIPTLWPSLPTVGFLWSNIRVRSTQRTTTAKRNATLAIFGKKRAMAKHCLIGSVIIEAIHQVLRNSSGNLAKLTVIRRASSLVGSLATDRRPGFFLEIDIRQAPVRCGRGQRSRRLVSRRTRRRETAGGHGRLCRTNCDLLGIRQFALDQKIGTNNWGKTFMCEVTGELK